jgi:hypothetical protein
MATQVTELRASLKREINPPGVEQFDDISNSELDGYILDGFWESYLLDMLQAYTVIDGADLDTPVANTTWFITAGDTNDTTDTDLPMHFQMLVVIFAGFRLIRMKGISLATNFSSQAGPVEYEQQISATVLRAILQSLERRLQELKELYSDELGGGTFVYMDGVYQREASLVEGLPQLAIL